MHDEYIKAALGVRSEERKKHPDVTTPFNSFEGELPRRECSISQLRMTPKEQIDGQEQIKNLSWS